MSDNLRGCQSCAVGRRPDLKDSMLEEMVSSMHGLKLEGHFRRHRITPLHAWLLRVFCYFYSLIDQYLRLREFKQTCWKSTEIYRHCYTRTKQRSGRLTALKQICTLPAARFMIGQESEMCGKCTTESNRNFWIKNNRRAEY